MTAKEIVDGILDEGWLDRGWQNMKRLSGIGNDLLGLGKNTEKGWKPRYGQSGISPKAPKQPSRYRPPEDTQIWDLDR